MTLFNYRARNMSGQLVKGSMEAPSAEEIARKLRGMGCMPTQVSATTGEARQRLWTGFLPGVKPEDMTVWTFQIAHLINSGVNVPAALQIAREETVNQTLKDVTDGVARHVDSGDSFSEALARYPHVFSKLFLNMVRAGETAGRLDQVLLNYAAYLERQEELRQKIHGALHYPLILVLTGCTVITYVVVGLIPQFVEIFTDAGVPLPLPTVIVYRTAQAVRAFWVPGLAGLAALYLGLRFYGATPAGRLVFDRLKLRLPFAGFLVRRTAVARFARTLGTLVASGVPILQALENAAEVLGNTVMTRAVDESRRQVERGERIAASLKKTGEFPPDAVQMIASGEEGGSLDHMLEKLADFYDRYLAYAFKKITIMFEPLLLCVMGVVVGFIMLSTLLPMLDMVSLMRR